MKYLNTEVTFREFPDEISLCINISGCQFRCPDCHSKELWEDAGFELTKEELKNLIDSNKGISCVGFMGGVPEEVNDLAFFISTFNPMLKVGWYWGGNEVPKEIDLKNFDYIKLGPYIKERGGLDNPNTNQKMYAYNKYYSDYTIGKSWRNITYKFWKKGR